MSFKATLTVEGKDYNLLYCSQSLFQKSERGRVTSGVRGGVIVLIMDGTDDDLLGEWASGPTSKKNGEIIFERIDQQSTLQKLEFEDAYATMYFELLTSSYIDADATFEAINTLLLLDVNKDSDLGIRVISNTKTLLRFSERTRVSYCTLLRLSAAKIKLDGIDHQNT